MGVGVCLYTPLDVGQHIDPDAPYWDNEYHEFYSANITHNLTTMASEAHLYEAIWRPYELFNISEPDEHKAEIYAEDITKELKHGLDLLKSDPNHYRTFDSPNGWGTYTNFVPFVEKYLDACIKYPKARVDVSR